MMKKFILFCTAIFFIQYSFAEIYVKEDSHGDISYSDIPTADAKPITLPSVPVSTTTTEEVKKTTVVDTKQFAGYTTFRIVSPVDQETIQNQPNIPVTLKTEPELEKDHKIQMYLDGQPSGAAFAGTHIDLGLVERGSHELYGLIIDKENKNVMQSNVITVYVMRARLGIPNNNVPPRGK